MQRSRLRQSMSALGRGIDLFRRLIANFLFVAMLVLVFVSLRGGLPINIPDGAALVVAPEGTLVEQADPTPLFDLSDLFFQAEVVQAEVRDLVGVIERAKDDPRISTLVLELSDLVGGELTKLQTVGDAVLEFKRSGKRVVAYADSYNQATYYLAALADDVYLHPMGMVLIEGFGAYQHYFKDLLDKLSVDVHVFRAGKHKSAVEPFIRNDMSASTKAVNRQWLDDLWRSYRVTVAEARGTQPQALQAYVDEFDQRLAAVDGDAAKAALKAGLVTKLLDRQSFAETLKETVGPGADGAFKQVAHLPYLKAVGRPANPGAEGVVGVVLVSGAIVEGDSLAQGASADLVAGQIRRAAEDPSIDAILLRIDSPGGSAFGSEVIRQAAERAKRNGKPVVVSMGSVAASGGYWIALAGDEIWASPATITGSIGVFGILPTYQRSLSRLGIHTDGVGTTELAGALRLDRDLQPQVAKAIELMVRNTYRNFIEKVAQARGLSVARIDEIAQGRVWSGADAHDIGLVDRLGNMEQAAAAAAERAGLDSYELRYVPPEAGLLQTVLSQMGRPVSVWLADRLLPPGLRQLLAHRFGNGWANRLLGDPRGIYADCLCAAP